jgi:hypothetical protein
MSALKKYGFGAIGFSFSIAAFALQWSTLTLGFFHQEREQRDGPDGWSKIYLNIDTIIWGLYLSNYRYDREIVLEIPLQHGSSRSQIGCYRVAMESPIQSRC